jgi:tRNA (cmo5U34)-methyltransferase
MLARSIPQYAVMRKGVADIASRHAVDNAHIMDLGTSRGGAIADLIEARGTKCRYVGLEISKPMLEHAQRRFAAFDGYVNIREHDLRRGIPNIPCSVVLSILTLQFVPIEYRLGIVQAVYNTLRPGGAFILLEKILGNSGSIDSLMVDLYYSLKGANGYSGEEIERKRTSLEGVLVPITARWNEDMLNQAGFRQVDCFWRWMNFAGMGSCEMMWLAKRRSAQHRIPGSA